MADFKENCRDAASNMALIEQFKWNISPSAQSHRIHHTLTPLVKVVAAGKRLVSAANQSGLAVIPVTRVALEVTF